jgi:hypothetical protein
VPITGAEGVGDWELIVTPVDASEVQPEEFETVKVYEPADSPEIVVLLPDPFVVTPPGSLVTVHVPLDGNPLRATLPVETLHVG